MTSLSPEDLKTLEHTRQRLTQLTTALANLQQAIINSDPLPAPSRIQAFLTILSTSLEAYTTHLTASPALSTLVAFPLSSYPGKNPDAAGLLQVLLRKKLETGSEEWVERGRARGEEVGLEGLGGISRGASSGGGIGGIGSGVNGVGEGGKGGDEGEEDEVIEENMGLWEWARMEANRVAKDYDWGGLKEAEEGSEEGDEDEDEDMEDGDKKEDSASTDAKEGSEEDQREPLPVGDVLRFLSTGRPPAGRI